MHDDTTDTAFYKMIDEQWESMLHKSKSWVNRTSPPQHDMSNPKNNTTIHICTERLQNDTGANRVVSSNKGIMESYEDIEPFPIGGVKADDIAIVCTGRGFLPWISMEGICTMVETLYCVEVDGIIVSPTTVVQQHSDLYQGFTIEADTDNGTGILRLMHRDGVQHISYPMTLTNGLWYHEFIPRHAATATVKRLNDACLSNLWHGRLAHAGGDIMDDIHKHVIGIDKPLIRNPLYKCPHYRLS